MKKTTLIFALEICFVLLHDFVSAQNNLQLQYKSAGLKVKIGAVTMSKKPNDTLYVDFKLMKDGRKVFKQELMQGQAVDAFLIDEGNDKQQLSVQSVVDIRGSKDRMRQQMVFLLFDRSKSITLDVLGKQYYVVEEIVNTFEDAKVYLAFMENGTVSGKREITRDERTYRSYFADQPAGQKHLYQSVLGVIDDMKKEEQYQGDKFIFVFTDGEIFDYDRNEFIGGIGEIDCKEKYDNLMLNLMEDSTEENIPVFCFYMGSDKQLDDKVRLRLENLASPLGMDGMEGHFFEVVDIDSLSSMMMRTLDSMSSDYRLVLINKSGRVYDGTPITMSVGVNVGGQPYAYGEDCYSFGSKDNPVVIGANNRSKSLWIGLLLGLLAIALVFMMMQIILPAISYRLFRSKYQKEYHSGTDGEEKRCTICKQPLKNGQKVTTQCKHQMHWFCFEEANGLCPLCNDGDHYYNKRNLMNHRNAIPSIKWVLWGMSAGLAGWLIIRLLCYPELFEGLIESLVDMICHGDTEDVIMKLLPKMVTKLQVNILGGAVLGFFITFGYGYVLEYRKKNASVLGSILLRAMVGAMMGFVAFLLGSIIIIATRNENPCLWIDWVSWMLFAVAMAITISYHTEVELKRAIIGGLISIVVSYFVLFFLAPIGPNAAMFSYMFFAAGLGASIYVVHTRSERYSLAFKYGEMEKEIHINKWMNASGGNQHVFIGSDTNSTIAMNWDKTSGIPGKAVELYLEEELPYMKVLANGVHFQDRIINPGTVMNLRDGFSFSIGDTTFTYIEKQENNKS